MCPPPTPISEHFKGRGLTDAPSILNLCFCLSFLQLLQKNYHKLHDFKITKKHSLTVLEATGLKSGCQQGYVPSKSFQRDSSLTLMASGGPRCSFVCSLHLHVAPSSLCLCLWVLISYKNTSPIGFKAHPSPVQPHLD